MIINDCWDDDMYKVSDSMCSVLLTYSQNFIQQKYKKKSFCRISKEFTTQESLVISLLYYTYASTISLFSGSDLTTPNVRPLVSQSTNCKTL